jgi:hypothetical protein
VAIKWSAVRVAEAMDTAEELVNQAIPYLEQALAVAEEARTIDNLPQYMTERVGRLSYEIKRTIGGFMLGQTMPGALRASIASVREAIPDGAIEAERSRGPQQQLSL